MSTTERHIVMSKSVARRWVAGLAQPEFRVRVLLGSGDAKNVIGMLKSFRDRKISMGLPPVRSLGIKEAFEYLDLWTPDRDGLIGLKDWFEKKGFETTGVW